MADNRSDFDREMSRLESEIKRLEVEYNMFFAGRLPRLPWETRARVEQMVKQYDRMNLPNTAQRFRFSTVQAKFMSFCELWERNLRSKEEGRGPRGRATPAPSPTPVPAAPSSTGDSGALDADEPIDLRTPPPVPAAPEAPPAAPLAASARDVAPPPRAAVAAAARREAIDTTRIRDLGRDSDRVTALYDELTRARKSTGEAPMPFDRFAMAVKAQVAKLGGGKSDVDFKVTVNRGKVTLMAKKAEE